ncbi:MAG: shikimate dehydrogenase, partial [Candidatus Marinimicrobia bacterium]|nr:shikimate dehydrogenase [Candidatus Neomarinimicrobiota bacterium]
MTSKKQFGLLGENISYTRSPILHNLIGKQKNINFNYEIFDIRKKKLDKFMNSEAQKLDGFNITIPYKEKVIPYLEKIDSAAKKIGAINTIKVIDGKFYAFNTDILGFMKTVQSQISEYQKYFPVLIGYGGVSKAVIFGLEELGFE